MAKIEEWLKEENLKQITKWARNKNYNISNIASRMGISASTFYEWRKNHPEIEAAFQEGRRVLDEKVENSFFDMCIGFVKKVKKQHKLRRKEFNENGKGIAEYEELVEAEDEEYIPPNVAAQKFYLCNRMPDRYRPETAVLPPGKDDEDTTGVVVMPEVKEIEESEIIDAEIVEGDEEDAV